MRLADQYNVSAFRPRAYTLAGFFIGLIGILIIRLWFLQIWMGEQYRAFSDQNRFKQEEISAPRGRIYDRHDRLLADNRPRFDVIFTRGYAPEPEKQLEILRDIFRWDESTYKERKKKALKAAPYKGEQIARDITWSQLALIESKSLILTGVDVRTIAVRDYLYGDAFFHVIGYTGEINDYQLKDLQEKFPERKYDLGDQIGIFGAERLYEFILRGEDGRRSVVVDVNGRPVNEEEMDLFAQESRVPAIAGKALKMSLDLELQLETIRAIGDRQGAAVAMDPQTGQLLAMVSRPAIDPNIFTQFVDRKALRELETRPDKPFLDRTLGEHYPPGSTYKILMALAALEEGVIEADTIINCPGFFRFGRRIWHDHNRAGFGPISVREAIKKSSNVFFFNVGLDLNLDRMFQWSRYLGLGRRTWPGHEVFSGEGNRLDYLRRLNQEQTGFIPTAHWVKTKGHTTVGAETINAGIGQGGFLVTITQLARMLSSLANGGTVFQPQLVLRKSNADLENADLENAEEYKAVVENQLKIAEEHRLLVLDGMQAVVNETGGTARRARLKEVKVGGKTGTSQVVSLRHLEGDEDEQDTRFQDHALFIGLAPVENPSIVVAVIIENGGSGGRTAAPVAKKMIENYLVRRTADRSL